MAESRVYVHEDGRTQAAYLGSELDKILAAAPEWALDEAKPERKPKPKAQPKAQAEDE